MVESHRLRRRSVLLGASGFLAPMAQPCRAAAQPVPLLSHTSAPYAMPNGPGLALAVAERVLDVVGLRPRIRFLPREEALLQALALPGAMVAPLRRSEMEAAGLRPGVRLASVAVGFGSLYSRPSVNGPRGAVAVVAGRAGPAGCAGTCHPFEDAPAAAAALLRREVEAWWGELPEMRHFLADAPVPLLFARARPGEELWLALAPGAGPTTPGELEDALALLEIADAPVLAPLLAEER